MPKRIIHLLIVDDTLTYQMGILDAIKKADPTYVCIISNSIREAQSQLRQQQFDLVISEYQLRDGIVLDLLALTTDIPLIVMTSLNHESIILRAIKSGVYDYLIKDALGHYLIALPIIIQSVLRRKQLDKERNERIFVDTLCDTVSTLNSTLKLDEILQRILQNVQRIIPHDSSSIMLIDDHVAQVALCSGWSEEAIPFILSKRFFIDEIDHFRLMYSLRVFCTIPDVSVFPSWVNVDGMYNPRSYLGAPICVDDEIIGFLNLDSLTINHFTPAHAERLRTFVDQAAIALKNAQLFQKAQALATIEERQRLARDLHDSVTQTLFAISVTTQAIFKQWKQDVYSVGESLEELQDLTEGALAEIRTLLLELRPSALLEADLGDLLRELCATTKGRSRLRVNFHSRGKTTTPPEVQVAFFRIAEESLNNIIKHSRAKQAHVRLTRREGRVELTIRDDGVGFNLQVIPPSHMGIKIMQERAQDAQIILTITSVPKSETIINALWIKKES